MTGLISSRSAVLDISPGSCSHNLSQLLTERSASFRPHTQNPVRGFPVPQSHVQMVRRSSAVASAPWPRLDILGQRERSPDFLFWHYLILIGFITWPRCTDDDRRRLMSAVTSPAQLPSARTSLFFCPGYFPQSPVPPYGTQVSSRGKKWNIGPTIPFM